VLLSLLFVEPGHAIVDTARFFSVTAVTTFGGAYAILSYVADQAVTNHGWLTQRDMVAGLAMAETTPGPLIMVVQFVGFMAAYSAPGDLSPIVAGVIASVVVTWVTFIPSLAVILTAAPRVERLRQSPRFQRASAGSIAVAIGGIIDLGLTFSSHVLFDDHTAFSSSLFSSEIPRMSTLNVGAFALLLVAGILVLKTQWTTTRVMAACLVLGLVGHPVTAMF
jgi:chromate transporter